MLTHENVWHAIDRLAATFGYSASGLAKQAGLDSTSFNKSKRIGPDGKPRWPSTESISRILTATGATMTEFLALMDMEEEDSLPCHVPLIGFAQAGSDGYFDKDGYPAGTGWDEVRFPDFNTGDDSNIYALEVSGDSMKPLLRKGDVIVVSPDAKIKRGDRVVVKTRDGEVMVKELARQNASQIDLKSLNPDCEDRSFAPKDIAWIARIIWVSQ